MATWPPLYRATLDLPRNLILDTPAIGWAGVIGVYGAASVPALIAMALAAFTDRRMTSNAVVALVLCVAFVWFAPQPIELEGKEKTVALIQGNIPQDVKWDRTFLSETMRRYDTLSTSAATGSDLIIWPEAAVPFFLSRAPGWDQWLRNRVTIWNQPLLFGGLKVTNEGETSDVPNAQNGLFLQMPGQGERSFTGKHHLVPFGEYVPSGCHG